MTTTEQWNGEPVAPALWGRDHYTTIAYAFTQAGRFLDRRKLRIDAPNYPTRLQGGALLHGHDDIDCLSDAVVAGVLVTSGTGINPAAVFTDEGLKLGQWLRSMIDSGQGRSSTWTWAEVCDASGAAPRAVGAPEPVMLGEVTP